MAKYIVLFLLILEVLTGVARCVATLNVWPSSGQINLNPVFIIEKPGPMRDWNGHVESIKELGKGRRVLLYTGRDTVDLESFAFFENGLGFEQILLRPKRPLRPNRKYRLLIPDIAQSLQKKGSYRYEKLEWRTTKIRDEKRPYYYGTVSETLQRTAVAEGIIEFEASFHLNNHNSSETTIKVLIRDVNAGTTFTLWTPIIKNEFWIMKNECIVMYEFKAEQVYELEFELMDSSGNMKKIKDQKLEFIRGRPN